MNLVSAYEARLLRMLQSILQRGPREQATKLLFAGAETPPCLGRAAVELVQSYLGKGCMSLLAREGWRAERFLAAGQVRTGRIWERSTPEDLGLAFSGQTLEFLFWILGAPERTWEPRIGDLTPGDRFLFFLAYRTLREAEAGKALHEHGYFRLDGLCRLCFPEDVGADKTEPDWLPWTTAPGSCILEAWQRPLTERWLRVEVAKGGLAKPAKMRAVGDNQEIVLRTFADALDRAGRWDLAQFLLRALGRLLSGSDTAQSWIGKLDVGELRLADRVSIYRAALAPLAHLRRLQDWQRQAQTVGYFEENYAASQLWKSIWEANHGDELCDRAARILAEVEPMRT